MTHEYINIFSPIQAYSLHFHLCREESKHEHLEWLQLKDALDSCRKDIFRREAKLAARTLARSPYQSES